MNKLFAKIGVFSLLMSAALYSWAGPCKAIALSCMQNGYYKGGEKAGKGLIKDCVLPVAMGNKKLPNTNFSPEQLQQCKMKVAEKMKDKVQQKMQQQ
ncbi:hypothetical protein OQJ18_04925 [Fluoribacter dumoffii]|uniref:Uncharacterized protein n=1 Tax=Fluoribacter dumoffii TaxID=463 RepID=A0A377G9E4_9GAMM|nr:hypothetical protein [Fluoribacter dumoffii]KTC90224.1 hypothetical protein Ldum_1292 [Fluoribacter dumoffii NY 23]MCW8385542.1 hypothetical protein [Fluoribacter dumoffii]MCW8418570.1 hypothetical protein [Fluoribacter dumoffii]MCW8453588.1 hypothetical protein [Fluoribacter dumoffii]MCW8459194.1 hypothetical protein [Fluoribacter dumoffii]